MKNMKKVFALVLALVMVLALSATAFAAGTGSITITPPSGTAASATNTYKIYKVFDADGDGTNISYKLVSGKTTAPAGFTVDAAGNVTYSGASTTNELTADDIAAIKAYITDADLVTTVTSTGTANAVAENLPNGYYYIETSTGSVVTIDSTNPNATVRDKNIIPPVEKIIDGVSTGNFDAKGKAAIAQVNSKVNYTATVTIEAGQKNYIFHDKMSAGLTYNNDVTVTATPAIETANWYTVKGTPDAGDTITITFVDGLPVGTVISIKYSATVNSDALTMDYANNTAKVTYGDNNVPTSEPETRVYLGSIEATKVDGKNTPATDDDSPLAGAGFVLKNAEGKYYKYNATAIEPVGNPAEPGYVPGQPAGVVWVDSIDDADEHISDADGKIAPFTGLGSGTYTLEEKTVPAGFNKVADVSATVPAPQTDASGNLTNGADLKVVVGPIINNKGVELPETGGIGTTIFYVVGALMMAAAVVLLITKKRVGNVK